MQERISCKNPLVIVGATGTGKTAFALQCAEYCIQQGYNPHIINIDSRQVYADFPIVSAQPTECEQEYCPHHLYGYLESDASVKAGEFVVRIHDTLATLEKDPKAIPLIVGGTGMYVDGLCNGFSHIPTIPPHIRQDVRTFVEQATEKSFELLSQCDKDYAQRITKNDVQKIARALEVYKATQIPFSQWHKNTVKILASSVVVGIDLPMEKLLPRLRQRILSMIQQGAIQEVEKLYKNRQDENLPALSIIGVKDILRYLSNAISYEELIESWLLNTRSYAKRQRTWFKNKTKPLWIEHPADTNFLHNIFLF